MMSSHRTAVALAFSLAAALVMTGVVSGTGVLHAGSPSAMAATLPTMRRSVVWYGVPAANPRSLHIESTSINASTEDEFQITYADGNFTLVYQKVAGGPITTQYTLTILGLAEWNDTAHNGSIEDGTPVAYTALGPNAFGRFPVAHSQRTTQDGIDVFSFLISSNKGDVALNLTIATGFVALPTGKILTPMEAKLTVDISHNMTYPDSRLSLHLGIATDQSVNLANQSWDDINEFSTDDRALNVSNDSVQSAAYFAWSNFATVNGLPGAVTTSGPFDNASTGAHEVYLSYPRPASGSLHLTIVHDPVMGVVSAAYLGGPTGQTPLPFQADAFLYVVSLALIAALVGTTVFLVHRRRQAR